MVGPQDPFSPDIIWLVDHPQHSTDTDVYQVRWFCLGFYMSRLVHCLKTATCGLKLIYTYILTLRPHRSHKPGSPHHFIIGVIIRSFSSKSSTNSSGLNWCRTSIMPPCVLPGKRVIFGAWPMNPTFQPHSPRPLNTFLSPSKQCRGHTGQRSGEKFILPLRSHH